MEEQLKELIKAAVREVINEVGLTIEKPDGFPEIMDLKQASEFVHLTKDYIKNYKDDLKIPHRRKGRTYIFLKSELLEWVRGREEEKQSKVRIAPIRTKGSVTRIV